MGEQAGELAGEMGELAGEGLRLCPRVGAKCVWGKEWGAWHLGKMGKMEKKIKKIYIKKKRRSHLVLLLQPLDLSLERLLDLIDALDLLLEDLALEALDPRRAALRAQREVLALELGVLLGRDRQNDFFFLLFRITLWTYGRSGGATSGKRQKNMSFVFALGLRSRGARSCSAPSVLRESATCFFSRSMERTRTETVSPTLNISEASLTNVSAIWET